MRDRARPREGRLGETRARIERDGLREVVERHGWNVTAAARDVGIPERTLRRMLDAHGVTRPTPAPARPVRPRGPQFRRIGPRAWEAIPAEA